MSRVISNFIEVRLHFEGQHCWPEAPDQVSFLQSPHRHLFHVRARMNVSHDDRELEFILVKRALEKFVSEWGFDLGRRSCETMAQQIIFYIRTKWNRDFIEVEVNEDGENGAVVRFE